MSPRSASFKRPIRQAAHNRAGEAAGLAPRPSGQKRKEKENAALRSGSLTKENEVSLISAHAPACVFGDAWEGVHGWMK